VHNAADIAAAEPHAARHDPRLRLKRPVLGERFHRIRPGALRIFRREEVKEGRVQLKPHREPVEFSIRATARTVSPAHHAPKLIRLIRRRYAMEGVKMVPRQGFQRARVEAPEARPRFEAELRAMLAEKVVPPFPKPTDCHPPLPRRERPSAAAFLRGRGDA
jgi:hypothetical protein